MTAGRPAKPPRRQIILRLDETLLAEVYALNPGLVDANGGTRYGSLNQYFTSLVVQDNEKKRALVRKKA